YLLNPGDPAIMDSLGWALFLRGDAQQALPHLEKAMAMMPDPEIAAHLGEVYWFLGSRDDAMKAWQRGLGQVPNHKNILETMRRLKVEQQNEEVGQ
ncbi:MAG: tetratricopeptide repeat protein, partial [Porticoccaceae bacterium]|nr:tetratricopeptide repeat protein [Porticoccaceae bacterium]